MTLVKNSKLIVQCVRWIQSGRLIITFPSSELWLWKWLQFFHDPSSADSSCHPCLGRWARATWFTSPNTLSWGYNNFITISVLLVPHLQWLNKRLNRKHTSGSWFGGEQQRSLWWKLERFWRGEILSTLCAIHHVTSPGRPKVPKDIQGKKYSLKNENLEEN